ncbi:M48 family metallopeptidase [Pseudidiomarina sp.]|uniref:M48 family metallopeptidase n=1 Tax=Pseudidiomarina sp. TaxID=2081707 RepID=UPI003A96C4BF
MQAEQFIECNGYVVEVIRSNRRKTADLKVEEGAVSIVVPQDTAADKIKQVLLSKRGWITQKLAAQREVMPASSRRFVSGEAIPYLGRNYRLKVETGHFKPAKLINGRLVVTVPADTNQSAMVRNAIIRWYKRHAEEKLSEKAERYANLMGVQPKSIGIKTFKSRWGSCLKNGHIDFNWLVMMAPNRVVDYVVIHEICHLTHYDHSTLFWKKVAKQMPDYEECRRWLRRNAHTLTL